MRNSHSQWSPFTQSQRLARSGAHRHRSGNIWLILIVVLAVLGGSGYALWKFKGTGSARNDDQPVIHLVARSPFDHVVLEQGEIESSSNIEVKCSVKGKGTTGTPILWVIDSGAYVKQGDELVRLDSSALEAEVKSQRIILSSAEALVISSDAAVRQAIIAREEYLEGTYKTERKAILSEVAVAQQDLRKAELSLASAERLAAKGTLKSLQIEAEQFAVQNARNKLEAAEGRLRVLDELTKEKMLVQFDSDIETKKAKLQSDKEAAEEEKRKLLELEEQFAACTIRAPKDGQVVYANKFSARGGSEFVVEAGAMVREQQTIIVLPDPTKMQVKAKINESNITLIRTGMPVKINLSAVAGDLLGQVVKVNMYAEPGSWFSSAVKEYAVFIQIENPPEQIRTGMNAEVRIFVEQLADAIQIPVLGIYEVKGHHFVLLKKGAEWETREIKIGATNETHITIKEGLAEGDEIVLNPRSHLDLMQIPEIEEANDREKLAEIAKKSVPGNGADGPSGTRPPGGGDSSAAGGPGAGGPAAGGPGAGGPGAGRGAGGGMNADAIVNMIFQGSDTDGDGKISKAEADANDRLKQGFDATDANHDGFVERDEMANAMKKRMSQGGGAPGGPGGGGAGGGQ